MSMRPENMEVVEALKNRSCGGAKFVCWLFLLLGLASFWATWRALEIFGDTEHKNFFFWVPFGFGIFCMLCSFAHWFGSRCGKCGKSWALIKIGDQEVGRSEAYRHYERPNSSNSNGFATGSHVYQNVTIETIYGCKYCGHIERRRSKKREQLDRDSL